MGTINLTLDKANQLSNAEIEAYFKENPNYNNLKNEFNGRFCCTYLVNNTWVFIYNEIGGHIASFVSSPDYIARLFAIKSEIFLNQIQK